MSNDSQRVETISKYCPIVHPLKVDALPGSHNRIETQNSPQARLENWKIWKQQMDKSKGSKAGPETERKVRMSLGPIL